MWSRRLLERLGTTQTHFSVKNGVRLFARSSTI
ncbi:hypothetical protein ACHAWF_001851 [Thalassiosira exigua]